MLKREPPLMLEPVDLFDGMLDPAVLRAAAVEAADPGRLGPPGCSKFSAPTRACLGALTLRVLVDHPGADPNRVAALAQQALRGTYTPRGDLALNESESQYPSQFFQHSVEQRATWQAVARELSDGDPLFLLGLVRWLRRAGSMVETLRARRDALDMQLHRLESMRQAPAGKGGR